MDPPPLLLLTVLIEQPPIQSDCCAAANNQQTPSTVVLQLPNTSTTVGSLSDVIVNHLNAECGGHRQRNSWAFFYPAKNRWLLKQDWPLKKYGFPNHHHHISSSSTKNDHVLVYTSKIKSIKIKLPDNTIRKHWVDFSAWTYIVVRSLCSELGIRHPEEHSLQKPDNQRHSTILSVDRGQFPRRPNSIIEFTNGISSLGRSKGNGLLKKFSLSKSLSRLETAADTQSCKSLCDLDEPSYASTRALDRHRKAIFSSKEKIFASLKSGLNQRTTDFDTIKTFVSSAQKITQGTLWLSSTKSLMEQNVQENDLLLLKFKYYLFMDLDKDIDTTRISQLFAQSRNEVFNELTCLDDDQIITFAALQLQTEIDTANCSETSVLSCSTILYANQAELKKSKVLQSKSKNEDDLVAKIDECLAAVPVEIPLENQTEKSTETPWKISAYIRYVKLKKYTFRAYRGKAALKLVGLFSSSFFKAYFIICDDGPNQSVTGARMLIYKNETDANKKNPISRGLVDVFDLYGSKIETNLTNAKGSNPRFIVRIQAYLSKMSELWLKFYSVDLYATWTSALRVAARGDALTDVSCLSEREIVLIDLRMRICKPEIEAYSDEDAMEIDERQDKSILLDPDAYLPHWYLSKKHLNGKSKQLSALIDKIKQYRLSYSELSVNEARLKYIELWQSLPQFGRAYYTVKFNKPNTHDEILCISQSGMEHINAHGQVASSWSFAQIISWDVNWRLYQIHMKLEFEDDNHEEEEGEGMKCRKIYILTGSKKICQSIHEFIGGYIFIALRSCSAMPHDENMENKTEPNAIIARNQLNDSLFLQLTRGGL